MPDDLLRLWRSARGCCLLLILLALLLALGACVAFGWGLARLTEAADRPALDVILVLDQSGSLWELGGVGTDPQGLRMEAARLFAAALGVERVEAGIERDGTRAALERLTAYSGAAEGDDDTVRSLKMAVRRYAEAIQANARVMAV